MSITRISHPQRLGDRLSEPDACAASFVLLFDGWLEDLLRFHTSVRRHCADVETVVVDNALDDDASEAISVLPGVVHVPLQQPMGYGAASNLGLRLATGRIAIVADTSVELTGDAVAGLAALLADESVGVAGPWGVVTSDGYEFEASPGPEVHAVEGYLLAVRRRMLVRTGLFDPKFKWYRNADLDFCFRVRSFGCRAVADGSLEAVRHEHRGWETTADRDELSRSNFARFRRHWDGRPDLFAPTGPA